jgi:hypothetical protein
MMNNTKEKVYENLFGAKSQQEAVKPSIVIGGRR